MKELRLLRHGERVRIEYAPMPGQTDGAMGRSTDEDRSDGHVAGVVKRFKNNVCLTDVRPQAFGWIKVIYKDAIEYAGMTKELRGMGFMIGVFGGLLMLGGGAIPGVYFPLSALEDPHDSWSVALFMFVFCPAVGLACALFAIWLATFCIRLDLFKPIDLPVIFDRRHRKVYRILREELPGWRGLLKRWPILACEYEWDLIDAEHEAEALATGATVDRNHYLMFLVRKSVDDPTIIDSFQIGNANMLGEQLVPAMWEHIRRFMEDDGPHLPTPDEPLANLEAPPGWWASVGATGVFGPGYFERWHTKPGIMLFMHIALPITLPMFLLWGTGNWLSYKTAIPVDWPREVKEAVGEATARGAQ